MKINGDSIKDIVYNTEKRYSSYISLLENDDQVAGKNKEFFLDFTKSCIGQGITKQRIMIYLRWLRVLGQQTEMIFDQTMTKKEVERIMAAIREKKNYAPWSIEGIKVTLKKYFRRLLKDLESTVLATKKDWKGRKPPIISLPGNSSEGSWKGTKIDLLERVSSLHAKKAESILEERPEMEDSVMQMAEFVQACIAFLPIYERTDRPDIFQKPSNVDVPEG